MVTVVISGKPGAGSSTTARLLAKKLGLRFFSSGDYYKRFGKGKETERAVSFWNTKKGSSTSFHNMLDKMVRKVLVKGDVAVDSKLGVRINKGYYDLGVWLNASRKERARRCASRDKISAKEALRIITEKEKKERLNWERIYGFDFFTQNKDANLVINTANKAPREIVDIIMKELRSRNLI
jgi:predicted cytidylate kinase